MDFDCKESHLSVFGLTPEQRTIRRYAQTIHVLALALLMGSIAFSVARWVYLGKSEVSGWLPEIMRLSALKGPAQLALPWRVVGFALECVPLLVLGWVLQHLMSLCRAFANGQFFHAGVVYSLQRMGKGLLALVAAQMVYEMAVTALLTWRYSLELGKPGGSIVVGVGAFELGVLLMGATVLLLARVMAQGQGMQDDLSGIV